MRLPKGEVKMAENWRSSFLCFFGLTQVAFNKIAKTKLMTLILPAGVANQNAGFASPCPLTDSST